MKTLTTVIPSIAIVLLLGSCALLERARMYGAEASARAALVECALSRLEREKNLNAINNWLEAERHDARAVALDCDGDGNPDFPAAEPR